MNDMTFEEFKKIVRDGIASGEIRISIELTDLDLAVQYAAGNIGDRKGYPAEITLDEMCEEIMNFAPELLEDGDEYEQ